MLFVAFSVVVPVVSVRLMAFPLVLSPVRVMLLAVSVLLPLRLMAFPLVLLPVRVMLFVAFSVAVPVRLMAFPLVLLPVRVMLLAVSVLQPLNRIPLSFPVPVPVNWMLPFDAFRVVLLIDIFTLFEAFAVPIVILPPLVVILTLLLMVILPLLVLAPDRLTFSLPLVDVMLLFTVMLPPACSVRLASLPLLLLIAALTVIFPFCAPSFVV